ncbi:hypothetical protein QJQ45_011182 [Haematococcus lacustris]|nr:hypothetical protein QJQ45_011182 [Haematococcus lacustris]
MDPAKLFSITIIVLICSLSARTLIEIRKNMARARRSSGSAPGLQLAYRVDCIGSLPPHLHRSQTERYTVLRGALYYNLNGREGRAEAGESFDVPKGVPHVVWTGLAADGSNETVATIKVTPAGLPAEEAYETLAGLSRDHGCLAHVPMLQTVAWAEAQDMELMVGPEFMRPVSRFVLGPLAMLMGYQATYKEYSLLNRTEWFKNRELREANPFRHDQVAKYKQCDADKQGHLYTASDTVKL